jgi:prepilin-type N-terminal cleavage/methylation domain-containing protein
MKRNNLKFLPSNGGGQSILAFTLIELLVVIAIIGILAAMLLSALNKAKTAALKTRAKTEIADIVNAIQSYDQDYSRFPLTPAEQTFGRTNDFTTGLVGFGPGINGDGSGYSFDNNSNVVAMLMDLTTYPNGTATANVNHQKNPKQVKYLNAKMSGSVPNDPNPLGGVDNTGVYRDPWGNPYVISMNTSYNEQGTSDLLYSLQSVSQDPSASAPQTGFYGLFNPDFSTNPNHFLYHGKVMVWSAGPDKQYGPVSARSGVNKDNILSWQ